MLLDFGTADSETEANAQHATSTHSTNSDSVDGRSTLIHISTAHLHLTQVPSGLYQFSQERNFKQVLSLFPHGWRVNRASFPRLRVMLSYYSALSYKNAALSYKKFALLRRVITQFGSVEKAKFSQKPSEIP